jgi:hypothetical protein
MSNQKESLYRICAYFGFEFKIIGFIRARNIDDLVEKIGPDYYNHSSPDYYKPGGLFATTELRYGTNVRNGEWWEISKDDGYYGYRYDG